MGCLGACLCYERLGDGVQPLSAHRALNPAYLVARLAASQPSGS